MDCPEETLPVHAVENPIVYMTQENVNSTVHFALSNRCCPEKVGPFIQNVHLSDVAVPYSESWEGSLWV